MVACLCFSNILAFKREQGLMSIVNENLRAPNFLSEIRSLSKLNSSARTTGVQQNYSAKV